MKTQSALILCTLILSQAVQATTAVIPGTSDPWLAGMPNGSTASSGDTAPAQSPVLVDGLVVPGSLYTFSVTGGVSHDPYYALQGPDGDINWITPHVDGAQNGIGSISAPLNSLIGVFLDAGQPNLNPAPSALDFTTPASRDFLSLSPALQQPFFIGDGLTSLNGIQQIVAPAGSARLFLGTMDGDGWYNNPGSFSALVTVVPEPCAASLVLIGLSSFWLSRKARK